MRVSLIYACDERGLIGKENDLPWYLPADLKHFKALTTGHPVLMGRKTFDSIYSRLKKPLPNRRNIVITRNRDWTVDGVEVAHSLGEALKLCRGEDEVFIIGGASIYRKAIDLDLADRIHRTVVHETFEGDAFFNLPEDGSWNLVKKERHEPEGKNEYAYSFQVLEREGFSEDRLI